MRGITPLRIVLAVVVIAMVVGGTLYLRSEADDAATLTGAFVLANPDHVNRLGNYCTGQRGFGDLQRTMPVTLWDAHGNIIATGAALTGVQENGTCRFSFTLNDVPDVDEYHLQAASRPVFIFSRHQLDTAGWNVNVVVDQ